MCTVVLGEESGARWICFNRDEQKSRPDADPPALHEGPHGPLAYARDPEGSGTWLAASSQGFIVAVLNYYVCSTQPVRSGPRSRGLLVIDLAGSESAASAASKLMSGNMEQYAPFHLLLMDRNTVRKFTWNGKSLVETPPGDCFCSTSSHDPEAVTAWRKAQWQKFSSSPVSLSLAAEQLRLTNPGKPAFGMTMDRDDARTVSQIEVELRPDGFTMSYRRRETAGPGYEEPVVIHYPERG